MNDTLETFIDKHGLETVLRSLETICHEKADHVQTNWQDSALAREWEQAGTLVGGCADAVSVCNPGTPSVQR